MSEQALDAETEAVEEAKAEPVRAAAAMPNSALFAYSGDIHIGLGADECPSIKDGKDCQDEDHFHAWVCLPNPLQIRDIGDKARAARARKIRSLKDRQSDSYVTMENALEEQSTEMSVVIKELVTQSVGKQLGDIIDKLKTREEFVYIDQDEEELRNLSRMSEEDRDEEEFKNLQATVESYHKELEAAIERRTDVERESLEALGDEPLIINKLRQKWIDEAGNDAYLNAYYAWMMFVGTRKINRHNQRIFVEFSDFKLAAPEVVRGIRQLVNELEMSSRGGGGQGN